MAEGKAGSRRKPKLKTMTLKLTDEDLRLLNDLAESLGTTAANLARESIRVRLAVSGMLSQKDTDRIISSNSWLFDVQTTLTEHLLELLRVIGEAKREEKGST